MYESEEVAVVFENREELGGLYLSDTGELIGIPSAGPIIRIGWGGQAVTHMGMHIPIDRIYKWLEREHYDFLFDPNKNEKECLDLRKKEIEAKKKSVKH